jgi:hypothetical protein
MVTRTILYKQYLNELPLFSREGWVEFFIPEPSFLSLEREISTAKCC